MKNISEKIDIDAMNNNHREVKEEFTKYLENKLLELGFESEKLKEGFEKMKEQNKIFKKNS